MSLEFDSPALVMSKLCEIERDLAIRQNTFETVTRSWYQAQREMEKARAVALLTADEKSVTEKKARGDLAAYDVEGAASEAEYKASKAVIDVLGQRASICQSVLRAQMTAGEVPQAIPGYLNSRPNSREPFASENVRDSLAGR